MNLSNVSEKVIELYNGWELRVMILLSLSLQIFLTMTGSRRKYTASIWLGRSVWLAYLSADWLATTILGILARSQGGSESNSTTSNASFIPAFWAPMLLVHLGGPDTITAYSIEDNELWLRHLFQLLSQFAVAFYASLMSWWNKDPLIYVVIPIFVSGIIRYGERIWVLWLASSNKFKESANKVRVRLRRQIYSDFFRTQESGESLISGLIHEISDTEQGRRYIHEILDTELGRHHINEIFDTERGMDRIHEILGTERDMDRIHEILGTERDMDRIHEILDTELGRHHIHEILDTDTELGRHHIHEILDTELGRHHINEILGTEGGVDRILEILGTERGMDRIHEILDTERGMDRINEILGTERTKDRINEIFIKAILDSERGMDRIDKFFVAGHNVETWGDMSIKRIDEILGFDDIIPEAKYLHEAHFLFQTLKLLFADYPVPFPIHMISCPFLKSKKAAEAFKLIEVELGFMFDVLSTKMNTTVCLQQRFILRFINFLSSVSALVAFSSMTIKSRTYSKIDIIVSYLLLVGAIVLEIYSTILMPFSDWAMLWLSKRKQRANKIYSSRLLSVLRTNKRWKACMGQHKQIDYAMSPTNNILQVFSTGFIQRWEVVDDDLKKLIFTSLLNMCPRYSSPGTQKEILAERGDYVLKKKDCLDKFGWSVVERDFHESFLIWHIAVNNYSDTGSCDLIPCKISRYLSHYMMYLWKDLPFMLPKELGEPIYKQAGSVKPDSDKLCDLFKWLHDEGGWSPEETWEMISEVLVEMLTYAANQCGWKEHAQALTQGGELLTFVAILMFHLGLNQRCIYY